MVFLKPEFLNVQDMLRFGGKEKVMFAREIAKTKIIFMVIL